VDAWAPKLNLFTDVEGSFSKKQPTCHWLVLNATLTFRQSFIPHVPGTDVACRQLPAETQTLVAPEGGVVGALAIWGCEIATVVIMIVRKLSGAMAFIFGPPIQNKFNCITPSSAA
jgi:hypothetical protein